MVLAHHKLILLVAAVLTLISGFFAAKLPIESDLRNLLPRTHPVVQNLEDVEERVGSIGSINVVVKGGTPEARHAFTEALAGEFEGDPMLESIDYRLDTDFFLVHALYYLSDEEFEDLEERFAAWQHYEVCTAAPDICTEDPDPDAEARLSKFIENKKTEATDRVGFRDYYESEEHQALVVLMSPNVPSSDFDFSVKITDTYRERVADLFATKGAWAGTDMDYNIVGPYVAKADEHRAVARDVFRSGAVALAFVLVVLFSLFRSLRAVYTLVIPLLCGVAWSLGATYAVLGHLNLMTSLISSVVMGMGIDAGIHFLSRARIEREEHDDHESIRRSFRVLTGPLLVASLTTVGAFFVMAISDFIAFREFGIIAAMGVIFCLLAMLSVFPALLAWVGIKPRKKSLPSRPVGASLLLAKPGLVFGVLVALTVASVAGFDRWREEPIEQSARGIMSDTVLADLMPDVALISDIFGKDIHAGVYVTDSYEEAERIYYEASGRLEANQRMGTSVVADLTAAPELMPHPEIDLEQRRRRIDLLTEDFSETIWERLGVDPPTGTDEFDDLDDLDEFDDPPPSQENADSKLTKEEAELLKKMLEAEPFVLDDLPPEILNKARGEDGSYPIFAYPDFDAANVRLGQVFLEETAAYTGGDAQGLYVGETTVYASLYRLLKQETPVTLGMALVLVVGLVFWQLRSVGQTALTVAPLLLAGWWLLACMGFFDFRFTLLNVPILTAVIGIGVDNGVYLTAAIRRRSKEDGALSRSVAETGRAIMAATATTAGGFAAFLVADSGGLRSIGVLAVTGISLAAAAALLVLPTISALVERREERREDGDRTPPEDAV